MLLKRATAVAALVLAACAAPDDYDPYPDCDPRTPPPPQRPVTIRQGVAGQVLFREGNFMPGGCTSGTISAVRRMVYVYRPTRLDQLTLVRGEHSGFYSAASTAVVDSVRSDSTGSYQVELPPGRYSILIRERGHLYVNRYDSRGNAGLVEVLPSRVTPHRIDITYASYE